MQSTKSELYFNKEKTLFCLLVFWLLELFLETFQLNEFSGNVTFPVFVKTEN